MINKTGGPAFPYAFPDKFEDDYNVCYGMTLRDYFAAKAMQGLITRRILDEERDAPYAYAIADAMLKARKA